MSVMLSWSLEKSNRECRHCLRSDLARFECVVSAGAIACCLHRVGVVVGGSGDIIGVEIDVVGVCSRLCWRCICLRLCMRSW